MQPNDLLLNRYRLNKSIGRGSFGEVWLAYDEVADLEVAIKIYVALDNHGLEEFRQEFKGVHDLIHQNILRPEHFDVADSCPFLVMPLCEGSVERKIGKMDEREVWQLVRDVSAGLSFLHQKEIIHRDIKPDNILLNREGRFLISDFGISTELRSTLMRSSTGQHQNISGTIPYMGPELFTKHPLAVKATDVWALGASLFEVMEGQLPFFGQGGGMLNHGAAIPALSGQWSPALRDTVEAMLSHEPWQRPTAEELSTYAEAQLKGQAIEMPWVKRGGEGRSEEGKNNGKETMKQNPHQTMKKPVEPLHDPQPTQPQSPKNRKGLWLGLAVLAVVLFSIFGVRSCNNYRQYAATHGKINGHEWVDLGLSVKWATCNVGASSPEEYGDYFAWGETSAKSSYTEANSKTYNRDMGSIAGDSSYDAARAKWGSSWRLPTKTEMEELKNRCTCTWTTQGGHKGYKVTGPNGNSIFLPAAGYRGGESLYGAGEYGLYWSATSDHSQCANDLDLGISSCHLLVNWNYRCDGFPVRPVSE